MDLKISFDLFRSGTFFMLSNFVLMKLSIEFLILLFSLSKKFSSVFWRIEVIKLSLSASS